jgi:hypothetical protein
MIHTNHIYEIPVNADGKRRITIAVEDEDAAAMAVISQHLQSTRNGWLTRTDAVRHALHFTAQAIANERNAR